MSVNEQSVFAEALEFQDPQAQAAFLDRVCAGNPDLRANVESLLSAYGAGAFLESPAAVPFSTADRSACTERPGTIIGPYKLLEQIGEGGFGIVYMAEQQQPVRRKVALKIVKPGMDTKQVVARFEAERQALAMMDHPNIAHVLDAGATDSGRPYFVMELIRGIPITQFCDDKRLTPRERLELFLTVCQAVQHAHQKGIIHRDLKPSNVLVTLQDRTPVVKVIDFGIAKALGQERLTDKTLFTGFAQMLGTPLYMSPEQAEMGGRDVDTHTDIYALGVLLYELLTGTTPFDKERLKEANYDEIRRIIREEEPAKPSTRISTLGQAATTVSANRKSEPRRLSQLVRGELDWIVMKALEKDRNRRYDAASSFAADVQRYLDDEPVQACPPSAGYRLRKFARKYRKPVTVAVVCVLAALLAAGNLLWVAQKRSETAGRVEEALQRASALQAQNKWPEALEAAQRAKELLELGGGSSDLRQRVQGVVADLKMVMRLEDIRLEKAAVRDRGLDDVQDVSFLYAQAFRDYGIEIESIDAGQRIRARRIHVELAAALDHWAHLLLDKMPRTGDEGNWMHLLAVAQAADPDPWRTQLRGTLGQSAMDKKLLQELAASPEIASQSAMTLRLLGTYLADAGEVDRAVRVLRQAQQWHPDNFWISNDLADYLERIGQLEEALRCRAAALALRPQSARPHYNLGRALLKKGALKQAIAAFNDAMRLVQEEAGIYINWGNALNKKSGLDEAVAAFKEASRLQPGEAGIYVTWGSALKNQGAMDEAIVAYDQAIVLLKKIQTGHPGPGPARALWRLAHEGRAEAFIALGLFEDAEKSYREALALDPADHWNWEIAAPLRLYLGDVEGYRLLCRGMLAQFSHTDDPKIAERTAGICLLAPDAVPDLRPVLQLAERAVAGTEQRAGYRFFLLAKGMADYRAGRCADAIDRLNLTLSLGREQRYAYNPSLAARAFLILAMAHQRLGHSGQARQALEQARRLEPRYTKIGRTKTLGPAWPQWLRFQIIRQEAERVVRDKAEAAGEALRPSNGFTGPASSGRLVCAPGPMALYFYRRPAPQSRRPKAMFLYTPNQGGGGPVGVALAALALLALDTPRAQSGFQAPLAFDAGANPVSVAVGDFNRDGIATWS
jgi:serine/threonine protein kinase/Flp pilus assembly protein TadD